MSTLIRQRAPQTWVLSICIIAVLLSLIFLHWNNAFYLHSLLKFYSKQKFLWFCHLVVYQHFTFFANSYQFYLVLLLKIKYRCSIPFTVMGKISRDCDKDVMLRVEKMELTPLSERIWGLKLVQIEPRSTHQKRGLSWITNWQFYWSRSYAQLSLKIPSQFEKYTWRYTWRPLACYAFINIKLAAYHLLMYVVYLCQKS